MRSFLDRLDAVILSGIGAAILGGIVRAFRCAPGAFSWWRFLGGVTQAVFVGLLCSCLLSSTDLPPNTKIALAGASGYASGDLLKCLAPMVRRALGID